MIPPKYVILGLDKEEDFKYLKQGWIESSESTEGSIYKSSGFLSHSGLWVERAYNISYDKTRPWTNYRSHGKMNVFECTVALCDGCLFSWILK